MELKKARKGSQNKERKSGRLFVFSDKDRIFFVSSTTGLFLFLSSFLPSFLCLSRGEENGHRIFPLSFSSSFGQGVLGISRFSKRQPDHHLLQRADIESILRICEKKEKKKKKEWFTLPLTQMLGTVFREVMALSSAWRAGPSLRRSISTTPNGTLLSFSNCLALLQ